VIEIICFLSIAGGPDNRIANEFEIFTESIKLNNLQSIAHRNRYQHLNSPETDRSQYITNHARIGRLSNQYRVDVPCSKTRLVDFSLTRRIPLSIYSLSDEIQVHLRSTLLSSVMVSDLTLHAYSIQRQISICKHSVFKYNPTPGTPLNREYPLRINLESVAASPQSVICQTLNC
jgi:hypothetical protein